jgi:molybdopterin-guanine dinucleotide biosynthesis protein B
VAVAADHPQPNETLPVFGLDDIKSIADFIERTTGLKGGRSA